MSLIALNEKAGDSRNQEESGPIAGRPLDEAMLEAEPPANVAVEASSDSGLDDDKMDAGIDPEEELKATVEAAASLPKVSGRKAKTRKRNADANVTMLTGDPVRMYLKEIGKVPLLTAEQEIDLAMKIEAGVAAEDELERIDKEGIEIDRRTRRRLSHEAQIGADAKDQLIEANLRLVVSSASFCRSLAASPPPRRSARRWAFPPSASARYRRSPGSQCRLRPPSERKRIPSPVTSSKTRALRTRSRRHPTPG